MDWALIVFGLSGILFVIFVDISRQRIKYGKDDLRNKWFLLILFFWAVLIVVAASLLMIK